MMKTKAVAVGTCMILLPKRILGFVADQQLPTTTASTCTGPRSAVRFLKSAINDSSKQEDEDDDDQVAVVEDETATTAIDPNAVDLKTKLMELAEKSQKGFSATSAEQKKARDVIYDLARYNPTSEPASPYYETSNHPAIDDAQSPSLVGKWNLMYTDAPDITGLDTSSNPFSAAKLGRIGQQCNPPYIKNVIEWRRPDWATNLPSFIPDLSGTDDSRVLQKVVTSASASPEKPFTVNLKVSGLELEAGDSSTGNDGNDDDLRRRIEKLGIPSAFLSQSGPIDLKGPLSNIIPFGQFEILYLDEDLRIIRTGQNYVAVNQRIQNGQEEWF